MSASNAWSDTHYGSKPVGRSNRIWNDAGGIWGPSPSPPPPQSQQYINADQLAAFVQNAVSEQTNLLWSEILSMKMEINRLKYALEQQQQPAKNQIVTYTKPGYDENMINLRK